MSKTMGFGAKVTIGLLAGSLVAVLAAVSRAADKPDLSGNWKFNSKQSDDAQAKIHEAQERSSSSRQRSGGGYPGTDPNGGGYPGGVPGTDYPGGRYPRGGIGGPLGGVGIGVPIGGVGRRGGEGRERPGISGEEWEALAATPKTLTIEQREKQIVLRDDSGNTQTLYLDGKKHKEDNLQGKKVSAKTEWEGDGLTTESKLGRSGTLTEMYRLTSEGKQLEVVSRLEDPALAAPLAIRRVYDRASTMSQ